MKMIGQNDVSIDAIAKLNSVEPQNPEEDIAIILIREEPLSPPCNCCNEIGVILQMEMLHTTFRRGLNPRLR